MVFVENHFTNDCLHFIEEQQYIKGGSNQSPILTNPFPPQQQQMVEANPTPLQ